MRKSAIRNPQSAIGIDASRAMLTQRTGTEHYSASLLHALAELPEAQKRPVTLYVNVRNPQSAIRNLQFDLPPAWSVRAIPFPRLWTHVRLSWEMLTRPPRTLFVPSHVVPLWHPRRTVVTVHDLGYLEYPQAHTRLSRLYLHLSTWFSAKAASRVIAISQATKRDLIKHYKIKPGKIEVIYHGRDPIFAPVADQVKIKEILGKYGITQPYCIHVGTLQPRKNLGILVEAWDMLRTRMERPPMLLLVGKRGWLYDSLLQSVQSRGLVDFIKFADYVERDDLPALYSGALALTFPSLYEGFGLPPLEAMSCSTPVLASNASSVPEVVGDAGILLDPKDAQAWADAVERVMQDSTLREELSGKGLKRAEQFTWEQCARRTYLVIGETGRATKAQVLAKAKQVFPEHKPTEILRMLDRFGTRQLKLKQIKRERRRVQLAILKLSNGNLERLNSIIERNRDLRDVLSAAEYPEQSQRSGEGNMTLEEKDAVRARDLKQYLDWLENDL